MCSFDNQASLAANFDLEITLILQALLYKYSVWESGATYGAKLQDLCYERPPRLKNVRYARMSLTRLLVVSRI